jgi:acyl dehydratase
MIDQPFAELAIGQKKTSRGRTMTEADVVNFCMLTGNWLELHSNVEFARHTLYGQRLVQGSMVFSIVNAMIPFSPEVVEAFYGADRLRFIKPTFIGDTLHATAEIIRLKEHGPNHGVATSMLNGVNQRGETVMACEFSLLVRKLRLTPSATVTGAKS